MARFDIVGFDDVQKKLIRYNSAAQKAAPKMLEAGAEVLVRTQKAVIKQMGLYDTGQFHDSIKASKVKIRNEERYIEVAPRGVDDKGMRNGLKGAYLEYGTSKYDAKPWRKTANAQAAEEVHKAMRKVWEEETVGG
jgi:HK97 gp10 family phage protein